MPRSRSAPIIERAPLPIVEVQGSRHIVSHVNPEFCRLLGKTRAELLGRPFAEIVHEGEKCVPVLDRVYETGEAATLAQEDGSKVDRAYWLYAMWPALDADERPVGVIIQLTKSVVFPPNAAAINEALLIAGLRQHELTDKAEKLNAQLQGEIAERKQAEAELKKTQAALEQHNQNLELRVLERTGKLQETIAELETFSYSISHDLRAPLRAMQSFAAILESERGEHVGVEGKEYIRRIIMAAERMDRLIQDVLVYSRVAREEMPFERIELGSFIVGILESYPQFDSDHAKIEVSVPLAAVRANPAALTQCVSNLIGNAIKFVAPGVKPHIRIWTELGADSRVRLFIRDNGIGIPEKAQKKIFGIFNQLDSSRGGTGIGLAVVRKAAERQGGSISVESEPGKGSTFRLELNSAREI